jgi:hypothetical protein
MKIMRMHVHKRARVKYVLLKLVRGRVDVLLHHLFLHLLKMTTIGTGIPQLQPHLSNPMTRIRVKKTQAQTIMIRMTGNK